MVFPDQSVFSCTATLVSAYVAITAGHCVHARDHGGFASTVYFLPGQHQDSFGGVVSAPYGVKTAAYIQTNNRWTQISGGSQIILTDARSDYAAVYFSTPWTFTNTFMPIQYNDSSTGIQNNAGYPGVVNGNQNSGLWLDYGVETTYSQTFLRNFQVRQFLIYDSHGDSGGPFFRYDQVNNTLVGVVSFGDPARGGGGVWIGGENQALITSFAAWTPSTGAPQQVAKGLRVPFVVSSADPEGQSYLRLINPTGAAGQVTIKFADGFSGAYLGTWTSPVIPALAAPQLGIGEIEPGISPPIDATKHTIYSLTITSTFNGFFQNILFNTGGQSLTNITGCGNGLSTDVLYMPDVHSSVPGGLGYPSYIIFHNIGNVADNAHIGVYAENGTRIGGVVINNIAPDASGYLTINTIESLLHYTPKATEGHYTLVLEGNFNGYLQHVVNNEGAKVYTNMSPKCDMPATN